MKQQFVFYDLETSGFKPSTDRIMQFAGIRTDLDMKPIGQPISFLIKLSEDILPSPDAILLTGISPQQTVAEGYSEAQSCQILMETVFTPNTIAVGFNNIRFDDEFIRYLFWRNFHDPYEWSWKDGRSRWDMLDVSRMARALRPGGINWPIGEDGKITNRLESLARANKIKQSKAHDALSDVEALVGLAKLIKHCQPQLFNYLLDIKDQKKVKQLVNLESPRPFVYASGALDPSFNNATVAFPLTTSKANKLIVYDLRIEPTAFCKMSISQLAKSINASYEERQANDYIKVPVKELSYNHCPAVAPLSVLDSGDGWNKLSLSLDQIQTNLEILAQNEDFAEKIRTVFESRSDYPKAVDPEAQLYESFIPDSDQALMRQVRSSDENRLADFQPNFVDDRLGELLLHYKARNFPRSLSESETVLWDKWRARKINEQLAPFVSSLQALSASQTDETKQYLLQELQLWAESLAPIG